MGNDPMETTADRWERRAKPASRRRGVVIGVVLVAVVAAVALAWISGYRPMAGMPPTPAKPAPTAAEFREGAMRCMKVRDLECAEINWAEYVRQRPIDGHGIANLAIVLNWRDKHEQAVVQFRKAVDGGEGTYDLFAWYADSLAKLGRIDDAIAWYYRALSVYPELVDVRGSLAKLLVKRQRPHEALALLQAYDADAAAHGRPAHFTGQRISIENLVLGSSEVDSGAPRPLRLTAMGGHFFVPVSFGNARPTPFVVDTGASRTTMSRAMLMASKAEYRVTEPQMTMLIADGRRLQAQGVMLARLHVGPFELKNVPAVICDGCASLLGQATLSQFDMQSSRVQGVEFMTLVRRGGLGGEKGR